MGYSYDEDAASGVTGRREAGDRRLAEHLCHRWGRELFPLDEEGHCEVRLLEVPEGMEEQARVAAGACPEQAITVIEDVAVAVAGRRG